MHPSDAAGNPPGTGPGNLPGTGLIDLTGEVCPMVFVRAMLHLDKIAFGESIRIVLKDGVQASQVTEYLEGRGHTVEASGGEGDRRIFTVRKGRPRSGTVDFR